MGQSGRRGREEAARKDVVLSVALVAAACGIVGLVFASFRQGGAYSKRVEQLDRALVGKPVRAEGMLVHHTLVKRDSPCEYRFRLQGEGDAQLPVRYATCALPDGFHDRDDEDLSVTVEGRLRDDGTLEATQIFTKCPSRYDKEKQRGAKRPWL
ncbi:MAG TPA: cytochrome c maturation protein CcmE [Labilithrix sp.]